MKRLIKYLLFCHIQLSSAFHDFLQENVIENSFFTIAYRNCNFQFIKTKLFERIALLNTYLEKQFLTGWECPIFGREGGREK